MNKTQGEVFVRLADVVDRLDTDDGSAVLVATSQGHRVAVLSPLGSALLDVLDGADGHPIRLDALVRALVDRLGRPVGVDPQQAVWEAVHALSDEHVVVAES
ncbi:hypothetical protein GCM10027053_33310 [Intrasporangium mesophilum]